MSVGFRKSLFGFNCDDVMQYIEKTHKTFKDKQTELTEQVEELNEKLNLSREDYAAVSAEKDRIALQLKEFTDKYDEIQRLSENIGKLYLVAQANAQAIMANSAESSTLASGEVERNIAAIDEAHESLGELKENILATSDAFVAEVDRMIASLTETKDKIAENTVSTEKCKTNFEEVYNSIVK